MPEAVKEKTPVKGFSIQRFDLDHYRKTEAYAALIDRIYNQAVSVFANIAARANPTPGDKPFSFDDHPTLKGMAQQAVSELAGKLKTIIKTGTQEEWLFACKKNDEFLNHILDTSKVKKSTLKKWQDRNLDALDAFQKRKSDGLDLSKRVWNYAGQMKASMELAIDVGLGEGKSAQQLSRDLKQYLVDPDKLFRRVRDKRGNLQLSKAAKAFHPGQGKYRSSYKNAMRLARSEINMAYATADQMRWQALDFVIGFEVKRSAHEYECDVCDKLKGRYPKSFNWKKWHPHCRCYAIPILMSYEDFNTDELNELKAAFKGTEYKKFVSKDTITDVPSGFKDWIAANAQRSANWASQPYFIRDNFVGGKLIGGLKPVIIENIDPSPGPDPTAEPVKPPVLPVKTPEDVVKETNKIGSHWFYRGFKVLGVDRSSHNNGSTDRTGNIWLSRQRLENVVKAIDKIRMDEDITYAEADSMATFWHEITHNRNTAPRGYLTMTQRIYMELANEFVARNTLPEFYAAYGAKKTPFPEFMKNRDSTGYNDMVCNFDKLIDKLGIDKQMVVNNVKEHLFNQPYDKQDDGLVNALYINKPRNSDGKLLNKTEIKSLIKRCSTTSKGYFEEIIEREFNIITH